MIKSISNLKIRSKDYDKKEIKDQFEKIKPYYDPDKTPYYDLISDQCFHGSIIEILYNNTICHRKIIIDLNL